MEKTMEKIVALAKARGFVYPGSEIYGGLANTWDYGNLGVELKNNVKRAWWQKFIQESPYNVGVDCAILMNPQTWVASGHLGGFSDPLMDCKECHERFRADKLIEDYCAEHEIKLEGSVDAWSQEQMMDFINPVAPNATAVNMVYELLLKNGKDLNSTIEDKNGYTLVNGTEMALVLKEITPEIIDGLLAAKPDKVIVLDKLFEGNDQLKTNTALQMKDAGIQFRTI